MTLPLCLHAVLVVSASNDEADMARGMKSVRTMLTHVFFFHLSKSLYCYVREPVAEFLRTREMFERGEDLLYRYIFSRRLFM